MYCSSNGEEPEPELRLRELLFKNWLEWCATEGEGQQGLVQMYILLVNTLALIFKSVPVGPTQSLRKSHSYMSFSKPHCLHSSSFIFLFSLPTDAYLLTYLHVH